MQHDNSAALGFPVIEQAGQLDLLVQMAQEIWNEVFLPLIGIEQLQYMLTHYHSRSVIEQEISNGMHYHLVEYSGKPAGYFAWRLDFDRLYIGKLYLLKEYRGLGLASQIFRFLDEKARSARKQYLSLRVNRGNEQAIAVYLHHSFQIRESIDERMGEHFYLNDYIMEKVLTD